MSYVCWLSDWEIDLVSKCIIKLDSDEMFTLVIATYHLISCDIKYNYVAGICWFPASLNGQHFSLTKMQVHARKVQPDMLMI